MLAPSMRAPPSERSQMRPSIWLSMPARSRCEIHYGGQVVYAIVMWSEFDRMGVRFPYELSHGPLFNALERARGAASAHPAQIFLSNRSAGFGRRGLS